MPEPLNEELRKAGDELLENHDSAVIADAIGDVENLDSENSDRTAELLRFMVGENSDFDL